MTTKIKRTVRRKVAAEPEGSLHSVSAAAVATAMHKANIPARFIRPEVKLSAFPWGKRVKQWLDVSLPEQVAEGKSLLIEGSADNDLPISAMIARTLVIRGADAMLKTLPELMDSSELRTPEYLIVSGFYDEAFNKQRGSPMTAKESYQLSWKLWRMANDGCALICYTSPRSAGMGNWWTIGATTNLFNKEETLTIS